MQSFHIRNFNFWSSYHCDDRYELAFLSKIAARRMTEVGKIAIDLALKTSLEERVDFVVYSSRHGEVGLSHDLITSILEGEIPSPMKFSASTHNAVGGLFSIIAQNPAPMTAISSGADSFIMGLLSALNYLGTHEEKQVLYIFADGKVPEIYAEKLTEPNENVVICMLITLNGSFKLIHAGENHIPQSLQSLEFIDWYTGKSENEKEFGRFKLVRDL